MPEQHTSAADHDPRSKLTEQLIAGLRAGTSREEVFRQLFDLHYPPILAFFIRRRAFTIQECEDLAQETFLRVFRSIDTFRQETRFKYWIFCIATNVYRSALNRRSAAKRDGFEVALEPGHDAFDPVNRLRASSSYDPLGQMLDEERLELLRKAMEELPAQMQRCVTLRVVEDLKYREIAEVMQISVQTVKAHLSYAREKLHGIISSELEETPLKVVQK